MPKFEVGIIEEYIAYQEVEADTPEEAYEKAIRGETEIKDREFLGVAEEYKYSCERI